MNHEAAPDAVRPGGAKEPGAPAMVTGTSVDPAEIARFSALAEEWWEPHGKFAPLHQLNPVRLAYIRDKLALHFGRDPLGPRPLRELRLLDIGCGGGLVAEPMARLGAIVTGIDASSRNVEIARAHAGQAELDLDYRAASAEQLADAGELYDVVLALEVVEHVADLNAFLAALARLVRPGGAAVLATLNRTPQAFLLAIVGAEYVLGWLARGTHDWRRFVRPSELAGGLRDGGMMIRDLTGIGYSPLADQWRQTRDLAVNYMGFATKAGATGD